MSDLYSEQDVSAFKKLRNYYKDNFESGKSDASFLTWCEYMCGIVKVVKLKVDPERIENSNC